MIQAGMKASLTAAALSAVLAGCQMTPGGPPPMRGPSPMNPPPGSGIEGNWIDQAGTGITVFRSGRFETIASDSGRRLSEGSYRLRDGNIVEISGTSIIRQTAVSFNCAVATPAQLNCTAGSGQQFVLTRYAGAMPQPEVSPPTAGGQAGPIRG